MESINDINSDGEGEWLDAWFAALRVRGLAAEEDIAHSGAAGEGAVRADGRAGSRGGVPGPWSTTTTASQVDATLQRHDPLPRQHWAKADRPEEEKAKAGGQQVECMEQEGEECPLVGDDGAVAREMRD